MGNSAFDKKAGRLSARSWDDIEGKWLSYLTDFAQGPITPVNSLTEHPGLKDAVKDTPNTGELRGEIPNYRPAVLREAIFLLHKSGHVLGAAETHAQSGLPSWSLSSAYHSAFFSLKSLLAFLGVTFPHDESNKQIMVDIWAGPPKGSRKQKFTEQIEMQFVRMPRLEHREMWILFRRALRVTTVEHWDDRITNALISVEPKEFSRQRNVLHYSNHLWLFDDLFDYLNDDRFEDLSESEKQLSDLVPTNPNFSMAVAFAMFHMTLGLFQSLTLMAPILQPELDHIATTLENHRHPYFRLIAA